MIWASMTRSGSWRDVVCQVAGSIVDTLDCLWHSVSSRLIHYCPAMTKSEGSQSASWDELLSSKLQGSQSARSSDNDASGRLRTIPPRRERTGLATSAGNWKGLICAIGAARVASAQGAGFLCVKKTPPRRGRFAMFSWGWTFGWVAARGPGHILPELICLRFTT